MVGMRFTWYRPNGRVKSRNDRFLVSKEWLDVWPKCTQHVLDRSISDHCPVLLKQNLVDWGPKSFKTLGCWFGDRRFEEFVKSSWGEGVGGARMRCLCC